MEENTHEEELKAKEEELNKKEEELKAREEANRKKEKKSLFSRIMNIILWIVLLAWMALVLVDYFHVRNEEEPQFCFFNHKTTKYNDGTITECTGLGYKVINYNRKSFKAIEFGGFWITPVEEATK